MIDPQEIAMYHNARRWLDRNGYGFIEIGAAVFVPFLDCPCVVDCIGMVANDGKPPYVGVIHVADREEKIGGGMSMLSPKDFCQVTDSEEIAKARVNWNRGRKTSIHKTEFSFDPRKIEASLVSLLRKEFKHEQEERERLAKSHKKVSDSVWRHRAVLQVILTMFREKYGLEAHDTRIDMGLIKEKRK